MTTRFLKVHSIAAALLWTLASTAATWAVVVPHSEQQSLLFRHPDVDFGQLYLTGDRLASQIDSGRFAALGVRPESTQVDLRTGRFATLYPGVALLPGSGVGNRLTWEALGERAPQTSRELQLAAAQAFRGYLARHAEELGIDLAEVADPSRVAVIDKDLIQIYAPRLVGGHPVLGSFLQASIRFGNLALFGALNWGDVDAGVAPALTAEQALEAVAARIAPALVGPTWKGANLAWLPVAHETELAPAAIGTGLDYRLVWVVRPALGDAEGRFEAWVDARNGEVLALRDTKQYVATQRTVRGGVFPLSNDGLSPNGIPDGVEQAGWPMPFTTVTVGTVTTNTDPGGNLEMCADGSISAGLSGPYLRMTDTCGTASLASTGDLDFGVSAGTDCTTPGFGGAGNTHASRTGFFELGQLEAMGRGQLPANAWLQAQLTANMNIVDTCNAFWDGVEVNFFRSGGGCRNTGEIAGIFDHEWGHGLDDNDANGVILSTGSEGIADIYANLRLSDSCVGRGFDAANAGCNGYGNPCIDPDGGGPLLICSGVRDFDWAHRSLNTPTTVTSIASCGGEPHCVGFLNGETVWDLWNRDLTGGTFNYSRNLAREIATQLTYYGVGAVNNWWSGAAPNGGCAATPATELPDRRRRQRQSRRRHAAHEGDLRCLQPAPDRLHRTDGDDGRLRGQSHDRADGDADGPGQERRPRLDLRGGSEQLSRLPDGRPLRLRVRQDPGRRGRRTGLHRQRSPEQAHVLLPGRADGHFRRLLRQRDLELHAGDADELRLERDTHGAGDAGEPVGDRRRRRPVPRQLRGGSVQVPLANIGTLPLTDVRITGASVTSAGHGGTTILTSFPKIVDPSFVTCESAVATLELIPQGLDAGETFSIDITFDADELAAPQTVSVDFDLLEGNLQFFATKPFTFEADAESWAVQEGTFNRTNANGGGAGGAGTFYFQSSANLDDQCDVVHSPIVRLSASSTLALSTNFRIEPFSAESGRIAPTWGSSTPRRTCGRPSLRRVAGPTTRAGRTASAALPGRPAGRGSPRPGLRAAGPRRRCRRRPSPAGRSGSRCATAPMRRPTTPAFASTT